MTHVNTILIVDDIAENRRLLATLISEYTDHDIMTASDGTVIFEIIENNLPDLILLDIMMPKMDGYEVAQQLQHKNLTCDIPIIFITAKTDVDSKVEAFHKGGVDYITKPFNKEELIARVNAQLNVKNLQDELKQKNKLLADRETHLTHLVEEKTKEIKLMAHTIVTVLEDANLANDDDTGNHIKRVSEYSALLATAIKADKEFVRRIKLYASLHDVGKVGISDAILKKPCRYTKNEREQIINHVIIGGRMLDNPLIDPMARNIALYHHEKWNGGGYCTGLKGDEIPLEARIVALADVYDALATKRIYKEAFSLEKVEKIISRERGQHFDPKIVDIYFEQRDNMNEIKQSLK